MATVIIQGSNGAQGALQVDEEGYLLVKGVGGGGATVTREVTVEVPVPDPQTVAENERLKAQLAATSGSLQQALQDIDTKSKQVDTKQQRISELEALQTRTQDQTDELNRLKLEVNNLNEEIKRLRAELDKKGAKVQTIVQYQPRFVVAKEAAAIWEAFMKEAQNPQPGCVYATSETATSRPAILASAMGSIVGTFETFYPQPGYDYHDLSLRVDAAAGGVRKTRLEMWCWPIYAVPKVKPVPGTDPKVTRVATETYKYATGFYGSLFGANSTFKTAECGTWAIEPHVVEFTPDTRAWPDREGRNEKAVVLDIWAEAPATPIYFLWKVKVTYV